MGLLDEIRSSLGGNDSEETTESKKSSVVIGYCNGCGTKLSIASGQSIFCPRCGNQVHAQELMARPTGTLTQDDAAMQSLLSDVKSMESVDDAVIFLKNYFDTYDWDSYYEKPNILIPEVERMVKSVKIKSGSKPIVWSLDFNSVAVPLSKKIASLVLAEKKMEELYSDVDNTDLMEVFDAYKSTINNIIDEKENLIKRLSCAIDNAKELKLDSAKLAEMESEFAKISKLLKSLTEVTDIDQVDALKKARAELEKKVIAMYAEKGIDAVATYKEAVEAFNAGKSQWRNALDNFIKIPKYLDVIKYIRKINKFFVFNKEVVFIAGKPFVLTEKKPLLPEAFNANAKGNSDAVAKKATADEVESFEGVTFELFPIVNEEPSEVPVVKDITELLCIYSSVLYFIKKNKQICSYNYITGEEKVIEEYRSKAYTTDKKWFSAAGDKLYLRKKLDLQVEKLGCFKELFKKPEFIKHVNNYSLVEINLSKGTVSTLVPEIVDVYHYNTKNLFYTTAEEKVITNSNHESTTEIVSQLMVINLETGATKSVLSENCDIHRIVGDKVIYSYHTPNELNKEMHVYDLATENDNVIENNIFSFVCVIKDRVYYKVGNKDYSPLFSNTFDGNDRIEVAENIGEVLAVRGNWLYLVVGAGYNRLLVKISHDGKKVIYLCSAFKTILKVTDTYVYYTNYFDELCVVRFDGKEDRVIASNIDSNNVIVEKNGFFYLRRELVENRKRAYSLYFMDADGHNIKKIAFNVLRMMDYDDEKLYISKKETVDFEVTVPENKGKKHTEITTCVLSKVIEYNKLTGEFTTIRTIGLPHEEYEIKNGCFRKPEKVPATYKKIPSKLTYFREVESAGEVYQEQVDEAMAEQAAQKTNNSGCLSAK